MKPIVAKAWGVLWNTKIDGWRVLPAIVLAALLAFLVLGAVKSCSNSREDKAINALDASASKHEAEAVTHETKANDAKAQADALEKQRIEVQRLIDNYKIEVAAGARRLAERKRDNDTSKILVDDPNDHRTLDERDADLRAKLKQLYGSR